VCVCVCPSLNLVLVHRFWRDRCKVMLLQRGPDCVKNYTNY